MPTARSSRYPQLLDGDKYHMTRGGWLPRTDFEALEERRERHEALIDRRNAVHVEHSALVDTYETEDCAHADGLEAAFRDDGKPAPDARTSEEDRKKALAEADARSHAASQVVFNYACDVLDWLRGTVPEDWNPHLSAEAMRVPADGGAAGVLRTIRDEEQALLAEIAEARRALDAADLQLREYQPLKVWLARNGNGGVGQIMPGNDLRIPPTHTPGTKPRDLVVEGWWPKTPGEGEGMPLDDEEGSIDESDEWFHQLERESLIRGEL